MRTPDAHEMMVGPAPAVVLDVDGTRVLVEGAGAHTLVFVHGWPDTERLWDAQVAALRDRYVCVRFTLPGFDRPSREAFSLDAVVGRIHRIIEQACPGQRVTLVLHDWGCVFGAWVAVRHPAVVEAIVAVDIGDAGSRRHLTELTLGAKLMLVAYQSWLALAWRIGGGVGDAMSRGFARLVRAPADARTIHAGMAYPYAVTWWGVAGGAPRPPAVADVPTLFVYGERKPFMFHSRAWEREQAAKPGNAVVALPAGHWMVVSHADAFNAAVAEWLQRR